MGDIDHVGDAAHGFGDGDVIVVNAGERIGGEGWAEEVIRLELADGSPKGGEERRGDLEAGLAGHVPVRQLQELEFIVAEAGGSFLFLVTEATGFGAGPELMAGLAVGANHDARVETLAELPAPEFEGSGGGKLVIVIVRVDKESLHI